jgi:exosortase A
MPLDLALPATGALARIPQAWRAPLLRLALAWAVLVALARRDWAEMAHQWWDISTYNHILLIPPILAWLVRIRWPELSRLTPAAWWPGLAALLAAALLWLAGSATGINLVSQAGAVAMLMAAVPILLGPRVTAGLLFPLAYMAFLVPFGDEIVPALQAITAWMAVELTHLSGVPATIEGVFIDTPAGLFEVAEACSGVKFLVAMVALGTLAAHLCFVSWTRRALFMAAAVAVPVLANGVRAWGTIYIAQSQGIEFAAGFDHIVYGWVFFALVMAVLLGAAWRFFVRSPHDPLVDLARFEASPLLARLAPLGTGGWRAVAGVLLLASAAAWMDVTMRLL